MQFKDTVQSEKCMIRLHILLTSWANDSVQSEKCIIRHHVLLTSWTIQQQSLGSWVRLRTEVRGDFNIHGTRYF